MRKRSSVWFALLPVLMLAAQSAAPAPSPSPSRVDAPRADGAVTPLLVYRALKGTAGCAPLAVISHGAGGSENGYVYLARGLSALGFTTVVMGHRESGLSALRADIRQSGFRPGVQALVADPVAEGARLQDVDAVLQWSATQCRPPFRVLLGHSMGAETVMLEAGARNMIDVPTPPAGQDRFDAYVALSPEGPGIVFPEHAWSGINKPVLTLTGTRDQSLAGGPQVRQIPWRELPGSVGKCQWLGVIDGATHMNFGGGGLGAARVESLVLATLANYLAGTREGGCALPAPAAGMTLAAK